MSDTQKGDEEIRRILAGYIQRPEFKRFLSELDAQLISKNQSAVTVLSQFPGEGKSFVVCAIAVGFAAFLGKRVLIVDSTRHVDEVNFLSALVAAFTDDLTEGKLDLVSAHGLTGGMRGQTDFGFKRGLEHFGPSYDRVIIDTSPLYDTSQSSVDPIVIAKQGGVSLVVTSPLSMHVESVTELATQLKRSKVPLLGSVFFGGMSG